MKETVIINSKGESRRKLRGLPSNGAPGRTVGGIVQEKALRSLVGYLGKKGINPNSISKFLSGSKGSSTTLAPSAIGRTMISSAPKTSKSKGGVVCIAHRELIEGSILGTTAFSVAASYTLQPGDKKSFPWLSIQAAQYEQYRFKKLRFHYVPIVGTSVAGDVMLLADYNVQDPAPALEIDALDHPRAQSGSLWEPHTFACDISQMFGLGPRKFVRTTAVAGDQKTYDCGNFHLCINNSGVTTAVGKLFVEYEVEFFVPQLNPINITALKPTLVTMLEYPTNQTLTDGSSVPLSYSNAKGFDPLRIYTSTGVAMNIFTPPAGCYRVKVTAIFNGSVQEGVIYALYLQKNLADYPSTAASTIFATVSSYSTLINDQIIPFNGTDTLRVQAKFDGMTTTGTVVYTQLFLSLV